MPCISPTEALYFLCLIQNEVSIFYGLLTFAFAYWTFPRQSGVLARDAYPEDLDSSVNLVE